MPACEACWAEAQRQVVLLGGSVADRYHQLAKSKWCKTRAVSGVPGDPQEPTT